MNNRAVRRGRALVGPLRPDARRAAMKFCTDEGSWDLVGNNTPVFFVRDPCKFPDFIRTQKHDPKTHLRSTTAMWDFWSLSPKSLDEPPSAIDGDANRYDHRQGNDDYTQPGNLYRLMPADARARLQKATAGAMAGVPGEIVERKLEHFAKADPAYAEGVRKALK